MTAQGNFTRISLKYWDENGSEHVVDKNNLKIEARTDKNNKRYYFIRIAEPIQAKKLVLESEEIIPACVLSRFQRLVFTIMTLWKMILWDYMRMSFIQF